MRLTPCAARGDQKQEQLHKRDLLVSQIAEITSIVNYRIARTQLYRAEGSLLALRGIQFGAAESE